MLLWKLGMFKIRMIGYTLPKVIEFNEHRFILKIPLNRRTRNHFNTMYLGALTIGADLAAGLPIAYIARSQNIKLSLAFKSMNSEYLRRPDSHVFFKVENINQFIEMIRESSEEGKRITKDIPVDAFINLGSEKEELVAQFVLGLSIKVVL